MKRRICTLALLMEEGSHNEKLSGKTHQESIVHAQVFSQTIVNVTHPQERCLSDEIKSPFVAELAPLSRLPCRRMKKISYESFPVLYIKVSQAADEHKQGAAASSSPPLISISTSYSVLWNTIQLECHGDMFLVVNDDDDSLFYKKLRHIIFPVWLARAIDIVQIPIRSGDRCDVTL